MRDPVDERRRRLERLNLALEAIEDEVELDRVFAALPVAPPLPTAAELENARSLIRELGPTAAKNVRRLRRDIAAELDALESSNGE